MALELLRDALGLSLPGLSIEAQLQKMVPTRHVQDVTKDPNGIERELALVKVRGTGGARVEALRVSDIFRAKVVDTTHESFVFELAPVGGPLRGGGQAQGPAPL